MEDENIQSRYEISQSYDTDISPAKTVSHSLDDGIAVRKLNFSQSNKENRVPDDYAEEMGLELSEDLSEVDSIASSQMIDNGDLESQSHNVHVEDDQDSVVVIGDDSPEKESLYIDLRESQDGFDDLKESHDSFDESSDDGSQGSSSSQESYGITKLLEGEEEVHCAQPKSPSTQYWESVESIATESKNGSAKSTLEQANEGKKDQKDAVFTKPASTVSMASTVSVKPISRSSSVSVISSSTREDSREGLDGEGATERKKGKSHGIQIRESMYESTQYAQTDSIRMPPSQEEEIPGSQWWENDEAEIPDTSQDGMSSQSVYYDTIERVLDTDTEDMYSDNRAVKSHSLSNGADDDNANGKQIIG